MDINEIVQQRIEKSKDLKAKNVVLYPAETPEHITIGEALKDFQEGKKVTLCGRIMANRAHGKVNFMDLRDTTGKIQLYLKQDVVGEEKAALITGLDIADIISVSGELFRTRTQEPTVKVQDFTLLSKSLRPLPEKWHGLKDVELRYRQRYLDLLSNEDVKKVFLLRAGIVRAIRNFLDARGFLEVETPMMHDIAGGAAGRPFKTFHNEYGMELYLRIAPELYLKRLLVGGLDRVYEINRSFRNEGVSTRHNPEFTMLEVYQAYSDCEGMIRLTQDLFCHVAGEVLGKQELNYQGKVIDLKTPWKRQSFAGLVEEKFGIQPSDDPAAMLAKLQAKGLAVGQNRLSRSQINKIVEDSLEQDLLVNPTFITDYFTSLCPLAKTNKDNPLISERFELYLAGMEVANAYSELNDPLEQRRRFEEEVGGLNTEEKKSVDEEYLLALEHGMPPAGGLGIGIDRLVMLFADQPSIRDVILFPLLRPQEKSEEKV
ncbi:MAG: lysine--tRNA ligase [Candidatus Omnitrophica bacterium]|jgi:lysyl-tRNA synthetase class 2|nr:lysine--tRNA ligase [Candidatus Omnitrophota bacterium]MDD3274278.1 lysine--tRNA ligase [Candidatus Omnitrophota bacterium]MDD5077945.1 lysine--tRNA ligase [Candidatus Omnitrophota bacterium]MDD5725140.1 lysine--tRNA ligase [Candidatus Omnitrophota bacterium]